MSSSLAPPPLAADLPVGERVEQMRACLSKSLADGAGGVVMTYDIIQVYKTLVLSYGISLEGPCEDMKVQIHTHTQTFIYKLCRWSFI
jgi:hypothetical protein